MLVPYRYVVLIFICMVFLPAVPASAHEASQETKIMLSNMSDNAESIVEAALAKDAVGSQKLYQKIQQRMEQWHHHLNGQAFDERRSRELLMAYSWMRVIKIDIKQRAWVGTAIAANQLTASIIRFTNYPSLRQRDIAWMDYLARELLLLNMEDAKANAQLLAARRANLLETWTRIKTALISNNFRNKPLVLRGDTLIHLLRDNHEAKTAIATARKLLAFVDEVEQVK